MSPNRRTWFLPWLLSVLTVGVCIAQTGPLVRIDTNHGMVIVRLDSVRAPVTSRNFMAYVDSGYYTDGTFFRTVTMQNQPKDSIRIEVIQGGVAARFEEMTFEPIRLEKTDVTGLHHQNGTISMARSAPHTATWSFFICIGDQPDLDAGGRRNPDGQGFAAFGKVTQGMDVVRKIQQSPADGQSLRPPIRIRSITRIAEPAAPR